MRTLSLLLLLILPGMTVVGQTIVGSEHDFSNENWNTTGEICIVCHTPHNANTAVAEAPLWNRLLTSQTFTVYNSATLDATVGQPDGMSKLCLSCHDGSVALENFGTTTNGTNTLTGSANLGTNLSGDHPVSFLYDLALSQADNELWDPETTNSGLGGTISDDLLFNGKLECASCHDVHNSTGIAHLLRMSNSGSDFCLACHKK